MSLMLSWVCTAESRRRTEAATEWLLSSAIERAIDGMAFGQ
jgi:hypothetical protein